MPQNEETLSLKGNTLEYMFSQSHYKNRRIMSLDALFWLHHSLRTNLCSVTYQHLECCTTI